MHTHHELSRDLRSLGVEPGDILFVHSSFKSLGAVDGAAGAVVGALEDALGPAGLLLMPSFNLVVRDQRARTWDLARTPSTVGWLTEFFRRMPGTFRSDHYSHSVAARGKDAEQFVAEHGSTEGMDSPWDLPPWGKTYGDRSPMLKAYAAGGKVLMLGVDYHSSTYLHVVEVMDWRRRKVIDPRASYRWIDRDKLGEYWDTLGQLRRGRVGDADSRLFGIRPFVEMLCHAVAREPERFFKA